MVNKTNVLNSKLLNKRSPILLALLLTWLTIAPAIAQSSKRQNALQLTREATEFYQSGNWQPAAQSWQRAADLFANQKDSLNRVMALSNLSLTYQQLGMWQEAKGAVGESIDILKTQSESDRQQLLLSQSLDVLGKLQQEIGQSQKALATWQQAGKIHRQIGNRDRLIQNKINQAEAMQSLGFYPLACKTLLESLDLKSGECQLLPEVQIFDSSPSEIEVKASFSLADVLRATGKIQQSRAILEQTLQLKTALSSAMESKALLSLAKTERLLAKSPLVDSEVADKHLENAIIHYQQAIKESNEPAVNAQILLEQLNFSIELDRWQEVASLPPAIDDYLRRSRLNSRSIYTQINLAKSLILLHRRQPESQSFYGSDRLLAKAEKLSIDAIAKTRQIQDVRAESYAAGSLGRLYEERQQNDLARQYSDRALGLAQAARAKELAYQWNWQLARLYRETDELTAITYYHRAYNILNDLRSDLVTLTPEIQFSFRENIEPIYREYVDLLLLAPQPSQTNLKQAREVIEALQIAELDNFFQDTCIEARSTAIDNLDPNSAIFYSIILPDRLEVIAAFPGADLRNYKQKLSQIQLEEKVGELIPQLSTGQYKNPRPKPELLSLLQQFYDWFIEPIDEELKRKNTQTLVFVADSLLRNIPPGSFYDGDRYLIEQYSIAIAPGLQLTEPRSPDKQQTQVLTAGISQARQGFNELPGIESEITTIQQTFPADILINQSFTQSNLSNKVRSLPYRVVHIATHGQFSSQAEDTFILAWDKKINVNELGAILRSQQLQNDKPIELLVLSACQTARGDKLATLGIAGVAVRAGARSILASLWSVDDEATKELMTYFYQELNKDNVSKAEALSRAKTKILQQEIYSHPYFWSSFILVGNWL